MSVNEHLINLEKQAFALRDAGDMAQASVVLEQLLAEEPRWEHGYGYFSLAECYEEIARYEDAKNAYKKALQYGPDDLTLLGGYASFLYLRGENEEALHTYLKLLQIESSFGRQAASEDIKPAILELAERLGILRSSIDERILLAENVSKTR